MFGSDRQADQKSQRTRTKTHRLMVESARRREKWQHSVAADTMPVSTATAVDHKRSHTMLLGLILPAFADECVATV